MSDMRRHHVRCGYPKVECTCGAGDDNPLKRVEQRLSRVESRVVDIARAVGVSDLRVGKCAYCVKDDMNPDWPEASYYVDIPNLGVAWKSIVDAVPPEHPHGKAVVVRFEGRQLALVSINAVG